MRPLSVIASTLLIAAAALGETSKPIPVVVELFTSEGCSSCPPADKLLAELDRTQPVDGVRLIVLSEHVDYWNRLGWTDPYSSNQFSERQRRYAASLQADDIYTPQAVVDGHLEVVGSNSSKLTEAIKRAAKTERVPLKLQVSRNGRGVHVELQAGEGLPRAAEVFLALADDSVQSRVSAGENNGRMLAHTAVVRSLSKHGKIEQGGHVSADLQIDAKWGQHMRVIAFLAEREGGKILGSAAAEI